MAATTNKAARSVVTTALKNSRKQKAVVEFKDDGGGPEWWVMLPNGSVQVVDHASAALKEIQKAAARGNKGVTITTIEWRNVPTGFVPPKGEM